VSRHFSLDGRQVRTVVNNALKRVCIGPPPRFRVEPIETTEGLTIQVTLQQPTHAVGNVPTVISNSVKDFLSLNKGQVGISARGNTSRPETYTNVVVLYDHF